MRKVFCDECGAECDDGCNEVHLRTYQPFEEMNEERDVHYAQDLCRDCIVKVFKERKWVKL